MCFRVVSSAAGGALSFMAKRFKVLKEMKWQPLPQLTHRELAMKMIRTSGIGLADWHHAITQMINEEIKEEK